MKVLCACEESQAVCIEFRKLGHEAYSCDIQPCSGGHPEWHIQSDVVPLLIEAWDMIIAFPPCTHIANSGAAWFEKKRLDGRQQRALDFFMLFTELSCSKVAIENPVGIISTVWRKPDQIIQPYYFGDEFSKTTCLWLKGLPPLFHVPEDDLFYKKTHVGKGEFDVAKSGNRMAKWYSAASQKERSKTFPGIAKAMAKQWSIIK